MADAESRFEEINEANEVLKDPEKRAAYDQMGSNWKAGQEFQPPPNWDAGFEFRGGQGGAAVRRGRLVRRRRRDSIRATSSSRCSAGAAPAPAARAGAASVSKARTTTPRSLIDLEDAYRGAERTISLRAPVETPRRAHRDAGADPRRPHPAAASARASTCAWPGRARPAQAAGAAGDLYLEIEFNPHPRFRVEGADVYVELPLAPWEAALGATVDVPTPEGTVQLTIPKGSQAGRKLRLKGRGLPGKNPGDLYAVLAIVLPKADSDAGRAAYENQARAFPDFDPRAHLQG